MYVTKMEINAWTTNYMFSSAYAFAMHMAVKMNTMLLN